MKISICISTIRPTTLKAAVDSICNQTYQDWELVIVGQGSNAELRSLGETLAQTDNRIRYIHLEEYGLGKARNTGIHAAIGDIIAFTDDDCEAKNDWLSVTAEYFENNPDVGLVSGSLIAPPRKGRGFAVCPELIAIDTIYDPVVTNSRAPDRWDWVGANFALRRYAIELTGPFDEHLGAGSTFPACDDTDYKLRLEELGVKMLSTPRSIIYHTYGYRYGFKAFLRHKRNYALGNGAMSAKLTLLGDIRGQEWLNKTKRELFTELRRFRPYQLPFSFLRVWYFCKAYDSCLKQFEVDKTKGVLCSKYYLKAK